jgi:hypothetical protein
VYPKVGDFIVCSCPSQREGFFKALVVEDRGDAFHTVVNWQQPKKTIGALSGESKKEPNGELNMGLRKGDLVVSSNGIEGIVLDFRYSEYNSYYHKTVIYCTFVPPYLSNKVIKRKE